MTNIKKAVFLCFILVLFSSCKSKIDKTTPEYMYTDAMKHLKRGVYNEAAEKFEKIQDTAPFSEWSIRGQIMSAYSYYKAKEYQDSLRMIDHFTQFYPIHKDLDYIYYLKILNYYDRIVSIRKSRDITEESYLATKALLERFPDVKYTSDVEKKKIFIETYLSGNEMIIGRFYLNAQNYIGAINHFEFILNNYPNSKFVPEAHYRLVEAYSVLALESEVSTSYRELHNKYSSTKWFKYAQKITRKNK